MSDVVVTVPKNFAHECAPGLRGLAAWLAEGDAPGTPWTGVEWEFTTWGKLPYCTAGDGDRVYVVCEGRLVGYAPVIRTMFDEYTMRKVRAGKAYWGPVCFVRGGGAVAVTIDQSITGFRGWRYRWWDRADERAVVDVTAPRCPVCHQATARKRCPHCGYTAVVNKSHDGQLRQAARERNARSMAP